MPATTTKRLRVLQLGLGPIGIATARLALERPSLQLVGACDIREDLAGRPVAEAIDAAAPAEALVHADLTEALERTRPDVVIQTTGSRISSIVAQLDTLVEMGVAVVSSAEELVWPWHHHRATAERLDARARDRGARILGTGVNPGFVLDVLPIVLTAPCRDVRRVRAERVVDAATRRAPLQRKVGAGLDEVEFRRRVADQKLGHVGLVESAALIAAAFGWSVDDVHEHVVPVFSPLGQETPHVRIAPGRVAGLHHVASVTVAGEERIVLDLAMYIGASSPHDRITIDADPPIDVTISGGVAGDAATAAILLNSAPRLVAAAPGLRTALDLPLPRLDPPRPHG